MNVVHDIFPNFFDLIKEDSENRDISRYQMLLFCHHTKSHQCCSVASVGM